MQMSESVPWFGRNDSDIAIADRYRLLIDAVRDYAIFMLEPAGHIASWNPGAQRIKGYSADEIVGKHFSVFYTAEDIAAGKPAHLLETTVAQGCVEDEGWRVRKDGSRFWANVVITAVHDDDDTLVGFAKITRDMTERQRLEELEHSHAASALVQQARENEQKRIARELHDDLGQRLVALKMALAHHEAELGNALPEPLRANLSALAEITSQIDALTVSVRRIAADLRPSLLDDFGLEAALEWLAHDFQGRYGVAVQCPCAQRHNPFFERRKTLLPADRRRWDRLRTWRQDAARCVRAPWHARTHAAAWRVADGRQPARSGRHDYCRIPFAG
jgi:PAS domain S-box-containing protein